MENFQNEFIFWSLFFIYIKKKKIQFWITPVFLYLSGIQVIFKYPDVINFRATVFFYFFLVQPTGNTESSPNFNSRSTTEKFVIASLLVYCSTGCERENPEHICCWMHVLCPLSLQGVCAVTKKGCCCVGALEKRWTLCVCTLLWVPCCVFAAQLQTWMWFWMHSFLCSLMSCLQWHNYNSSSV